MTKRNKGPDRLCGFLLRGARINQSTRPAKSKPVRGSHDNPGVKTLGKTRKKSTVRNPERELEDPTLNTFLEKRRHGTRQQSAVRPRGARKAYSLTETEQKRLTHHERSERDTSVQVRGNDHQTPTHQTTSPLGRDDWKARTRTEDDSKAPSASTASSTCRKAGARGKYTRNVVTTPGSVRGEEKSLDREQGNRPEERTCLQDSASNATTASAEAGQPLKLKEEQPDGKTYSSSLSSILGVTTTPKEKEKGKREPSSRAASPSSYLVRKRRGRRAIPSRENDPKVIACSESGAEDTVYTHEAEVFARNKDGEGCDEQERQR